MKTIEKYPFNRTDYYGLGPQDLPLKLHEAIRFLESMYRVHESSASLTHPMEVLQILAGEQCIIEVAIAGVLHDILEETNCTGEEIEARFGKSVRSFVEENTEQLHAESRNGTLKIYRNKVLERQRTAVKEVRQIALADNVSTLRRLVYDYGCFGEALWERLNVTRDELGKYYLDVVDVFEESQGHEATKCEYWELNSLYKHLFADYYIHREGWTQTIYQNLSGELYAIRNDSMIWFVAEEIPEDAQKISKQEAEHLEDTWLDMLQES